MPQGTAHARPGHTFFTPEICRVYERHLHRRCYNWNVKSLSSRSSIKTGGGVDVAFAVVVLASYFSTFSALQTASALQISLMIALGTAYICNGIYGFGFCVRHPSLPLHLVYFAVQLCLGGSIIYLGKGTGFDALILMPLAGHTVMLLSANLVYPANLAIATSYILSMRFLTSDWSSIWSSLPIFIAGQVFIVVFVQMAVDEENARKEIERLAGELQEANQRLRDYALQVEDLTIIKERNRMAREIHDGLGHYLTIIHMQLQAIRAILTSDPQRASETLEIAQRLSRDALLEVRRSVATLRAKPEDELPLFERINQMLANCESVGIQTTFKVLGSPRPLTPQTELTLYRAAQEALNNTCKHAQASLFWITLDFSAGQEVRMSVGDNGVGTSDFRGGFGLTGIQERVHLLEGKLAITSSPGQGFLLEMEIPG